MTGSSSRISCKLLFQGLELLNLASQYILSLMRFLSQNLELYIFNSTMSGFNTRNKLHSHCQPPLQYTGQKDNTGGLKS